MQKSGKYAIRQCMQEVMIGDGGNDELEENNTLGRQAA